MSVVEKTEVSSAESTVGTLPENAKAVIQALDEAVLPFIDQCLQAGALEAVGMLATRFYELRCLIKSITAWSPPDA